MASNNRISSVDIMRGFTLIVMLFVTDLFLSGLPAAQTGSMTGFNSEGLGGWILSGFLFITGMVIPYSIGKRITEGQTANSIAKHIIKRSISLLILGILIVNSTRVNPEYTGIGKNLWTILMYTGAFLVWNHYHESEKNFFTITGLRIAGLAILVFVIFRFRSGEAINNGSLITGWWGFPGLIGWGYLIAAFIYLAIRENILNTIVALLFFLSFNILSNLNLLTSLDIVKPYLGVITEGTIPLIVLSGMLTTILVKKYSQEKSMKANGIIASISALTIITGYFLKQWYINSESVIAPGWGLIFTGINMMLFILIHMLTNTGKITFRTNFFNPAATNSLTAYLAANFIYSVILASGLPILIYKQSDVSLILIAGSLLWTLMIIGLTGLMVKYGIKLKL